MATELLHLLKAIAENDRGPAGFTGKLALGVCPASEAQAAVWLQLRFGSTTEAEFVSEPDTDSKAALLMGQSEATALLHGKDLPGPPNVLYRYGELRILQRFLDRYLRRRSMIDVRTRAN